MVFGSSYVENADLPPKTSSHLCIEWRETEFRAISVKAERLSYSHREAGERPDKSSIVVPPDANKEEDECLNRDDFVSVQKPGSSKCLLDSKPVFFDQILLFNPKIGFDLVSFRKY